MTKRASEDVLGSLHEAVAHSLLAKINSGEASPADLNAAIKFLQNNGIEAILKTGSPMDLLAKSLPTFTDGDDEYIN